MQRPDTLHVPATEPLSDATQGHDAKGSMTIITIEDAGKHDGQEVTLRGWLYNLRESGKLLFPIFRDGTGIIQGVVSLKEHPEAFEALQGADAGVERHRHRQIRAEQRAPGGYEMRRQRSQGGAEASPKPALSHPAQRAWRGFPARPPASVDAHAAAGGDPAHSRRGRFAPRANYMDSQGYTLTDAPMFTPAACEGTTTLFEVQYIDDQKAYLTQ